MTHPHPHPHPRRSRGRPAALVAALVACQLALAGCMGLPTEGPVVSAPIGEQVDVEAPVDFTPNGPTPGAPPTEIVRGWLVAMQATPLNTSVARQFLTAESSSRWVPEKGTIIYREEARTAEGNDVRLDLTDTVELDARGSWLGKEGAQSFDLDLVRERGQWRISNPPDHLVVPLTHFQTRFQQYSVYFFDKSAQVLVPEPVYVPTGAQATTFLVSALLRGPEQDLLGVERSFIPTRTALDDISVPVTQDGTAQVPLSDEVLDIEGDRLDLAFAQIAWTLAQVPGVERMRVTVDGTPIDLPGSGPEVKVSDWSEYDPSVDWASQALFGIRSGRVVANAGGEERRVSGVSGSVDLGLTSIGVDLPGERVAGVTDDGRVVVSPRSRKTGTTPQPSDARTVLSGGTDLLRPVWDLHGRLWVVDRTGSGAVLRVIHDGTVRELEVTGVSGEDVRAFVLSRDGTRLVAEVAGKNRDRLVQVRVQREPSGRVRGFGEPEPVPLGTLGVRKLRDLAWRTPSTLAVLTVPSTGTSQVLVVKVDGSSTRTEATADAEPFRDEADRLVTASTLGLPLYIRTPEGKMYALASNGRWVGAGIEPGLVSPTFVG